MFKRTGMLQQKLDADPKKDAETCDLPSVKIQLKDHPKLAMRQPRHTCTIRPHSPLESQGAMSSVFVNHFMAKPRQNPW